MQSVQDFINQTINDFLKNGTVPTSEEVAAIVAEHYGISLAAALEDVSSFRAWEESYYEQPQAARKMWS
jgi:hypothetical protein